MGGPGRPEHEVSHGLCPGLARGLSQHVVDAAELVLPRPGVPFVELAEQPPDLRLLPDLAVEEISLLCHPQIVEGAERTVTVA